MHKLIYIYIWFDNPTGKFILSARFISANKLTALERVNVGVLALRVALHCQFSLLCEFICCALWKNFVPQFFTPNITLFPINCIQHFLKIFQLVLNIEIVNHYQVLKFSIKLVTSKNWQGEYYICFKTLSFR